MIERIRIRAVRGIRHELKIELESRSLLIHGDNGTGKSSIEKALRWALGCGEEPTQEVPYSSQTSFRRHVKEDPGAPFVAVEIGGGEKIEVATSGEILTEKGQSYRDGCKVGNPFLRRSDLQEVLTAKPGERFHYLESFLDLGLCDQIQKGLEGKSQEYNNDARILAGRLARNIATLKPLLGESVIEDSWGAVVRRMLTLARQLKLSSSLELSEKDIPKIQQDIGDLTHGDALLKKRNSLQNALDKVLAFENEFRQARFKDTESLKETLQKARESVADADLLEILDHAKKHLEEKEIISCPVCLQAIDQKSVIESLSARLSQLQELKTLSQEMRDQVHAWTPHILELKGLIRSCSEGLENAKWDEIPGFPSPPEGIKLMIAKCNVPDDFAAALLLVGSRSIAIWLDDLLPWLKAKLNERISSLPSLNSIQELANLGKAIVKGYELRSQIMSDETRLNALRRRVDGLKRIAEAIRRARQDVAKELLEEIGSLVSEFYSFIHPPEDETEVTEAPLIDIQRHRDGTAYVRGSFCGELVKDPAWVYSDGHLDTVAMCIFLALRRFRGNRPTDPRLMVLDDIILSIDLGHARRLIELLKERFNDHQVIILTHNGLFAHWCASLLPNLKRLRIVRWTVDQGPEVGDYQAGVDRLHQATDSEDAKQIALALMALADEVMVECRLVYSLSVPAKYGEQYTLSEIWDPFVKALRDMNKALNNTMDSVVELASQIRDLPQVRNALAGHENEFAREYPLSTMREIGQTFLKLVEAIYCVNCKSYARPSPNRHKPDIVLCKCRKIQFVPAYSGS